MRIIAINGLWCYNAEPWRLVRPRLERRLPVRSFIELEEYACGVRTMHRLRRLTERVVSTMDDGVETLLLGHSMGGVVACSAAARFTRTPIRGIVTVFAPHRMFFGAFTRYLSAPDMLPAPILTFEAKHDEIVHGTRHRSSIEHIVLDSNHYDDLLRDHTVAERISAAIGLHFGRATRAACSA